MDKGIWEQNLWKSRLEGASFLKDDLWQVSRIKTHKQQQQVVFYLLGGLTIISLIFWNCFCQKRITESGIGLLIGMIKKGTWVGPLKSTVNLLETSYLGRIGYLSSFDSCCSKNSWPHRSKFCIWYHSCDLKLDAVFLDPRSKMSPDFTDVSSYCYCYCNTASADRLANSILQLKAIEFVSRSTWVDVISEAWRRRPSTFNCWKFPRD